MRVEISPKSRVDHMTASVLIEARGHVAALIGPQPPGSRLKMILPKVARSLGMTERRIRAIWNNEAKSIGADELDALRQAVASREINADVLAHAERLEAAARSLETIDADFHRADIDRLRNTARGMRDAMARGGRNRG